jgi:2-polyprenyl-3-methyl-5-hydroxy-6-metoxy-1,4-benzoquinol methylase
MANSIMVEFTHHNIRLDDGTFTKSASTRSMADYPYCISARGTLDAVFPGDKTGLRVVDIGCLEGGYAVEFARMGFDVLGIEVRASNIAACNYVKSKTDLPNLEFVQDNALNIASYGMFDAAFCSGLYHLDEPQQYLKTLSSVTRKLLILQTQFAIIRPIDAKLGLSTRTQQVVDKVLQKMEPVNFLLSAPAEHEGLPGRWFTEFKNDRAFDQRENSRWASWDNCRSFWIQREYLLQTIKDVGFDIVMEQYDHLEPSIAESLLGNSYYAQLRGMFVGIKTH